MGANNGSSMAGATPVVGPVALARGESFRTKVRLANRAVHFALAAREG